eukprot:12783122-Prorocentrum_lima.AAC.1
MDQGHDHARGCESDVPAWKEHHCLWSDEGAGKGKSANKLGKGCCCWRNILERCAVKRNSTSWERQEWVELKEKLKGTRNESGRNVRIPQEKAMLQKRRSVVV